MSDEGIDVPVYLCPKPGAMMLLLRAALAPTRDGSPYLLIQRQKPGIFRTFVSVHRGGDHTDGALMITGPEALSHAWAGGWADVINPTPGQLRSLAMYAVKTRDLVTWDEDYSLWWLSMHTASWNEREVLLAKNARAGALLARDKWAR